MRYYTSIYTFLSIYPSTHPSTYIPLMDKRRRGAKRMEGPRPRECPSKATASHARDERQRRCRRLEALRSHAREQRFLPSRLQAKERFFKREELATRSPCTVLYRSLSLAPSLPCLLPSYLPCLLTFSLPSFLSLPPSVPERKSGVWQKRNARVETK